MAKQPKNSGKSWSAAEKQQLRNEAKGNMPTRVIGLKHGRTPGAVAQKASELGISLKPTNQSPYGTSGRRRD